MKMRKFLAIMLTIVMVASMLCVSALAAGDPTFRGADIKAKAGDTITYDVYIENNPGIIGYKIQVDFSEDAFDLKSKKEDELENTFEIKLGDFSKNAASEGNVVSNTTAYGCVALWFNTMEVDTDGVALSVTLKVAKDAINGTHAVKIRCDAINTIDEEGLVAFETVDGSVTVSGGVDGVINNDEVGPSEEEIQQMEEGTLTQTGKPTTPNSSVVDKEEQLNVDGENVENNDVDAPNADNDDTDNDKGMNVVTLILIIVAAIVAIAVAALLIIKAKAKKASDVIDAIPGSDDREMEIEEVMGWNDADEAEIDDADDED